MIISSSRMINTKANIKTKVISISRVVIKVQDPDPRLGLITFLICNRIMNQISTISWGHRQTGNLLAPNVCDVSHPLKKNIEMRAKWDQFGNRRIWGVVGYEEQSDMRWGVDNSWCPLARRLLWQTRGSVPPPPPHFTISYNILQYSPILFTLVCQRVL